MTKRHGVVLNAAGHPQWRMGVWQLFDPWINPHLQLLQGIVVPTRTQPVNIEFHFRRVVHRLVRSLSRFDQQVREWNYFLEAGGLSSDHPELVFDIPEEGGIAVDGVFHYLNLFIDDLARLILIVLAHDEPNARKPDGFNDLKSWVIDGQVQAPATVKKLFADLNFSNSWWTHGFKRGGGIRQRLTHYTDLVYFHGSAKPGELKMTGDVSLISIGESERVPMFEDALREFFRKFCEWLDQLDPLLHRHLSDKLAAKGVSWNPLNSECPAIALPSQGSIQLNASHYMYLPVFDDAQ